MNKILYIFRSIIRDSQDVLEGAPSSGDGFNGDSQDTVEIYHPDSVNDLHRLVDQDVLAFIGSEQDFRTLAFWMLKWADIDEKMFYTRISGFWLRLQTDK